VREVIPGVEKEVVGVGRWAGCVREREVIPVVDVGGACGWVRGVNEQNQDTFLLFLFFLGPPRFVFYFLPCSRFPLPDIYINSPRSFPILTKIRVQSIQGQIAARPSTYDAYNVLHPFRIVHRGPS
jgi:hypothetical protein